ncbi:hypothetical protein [Pedobacter psychroterrae]|uniref:LIVCS family branched-chain amino acid:cation transporter n=1 Tax=Pedobacter psychroterrae TaxID=2530453 RepID=A0A4R0NAU7_9SPHI|nr:hypothetical protein [Pedobacter psychroterrae]TCC97399.1 hypothetical protein EZ437_20140 [Pedobacter psychroterrae]
MLKKILGINLLVFVAYAILININSAVADRGFNIAIGMGVCIALQVGLNVVAGIVCLIMGRKEPARSFLISSATLVPIGFCTWLILLSIFG